MSIVYKEEEIRENEQEGDFREKKGLVDGGDVPLHCEDCGRLLLTLTITRPNFKFKNGEPFEGLYKVKCCFNVNGSPCGGSSKTVFVKGGFATTYPSDEEDKFVLLHVEKHEEVDGVTIFHTKLAKKQK